MQEIELESSQENTQSKIRNKKKIIGLVSSFILASIDLIRALAVRLVFILHILIAISMVSYIHNDMWYMVNIVGVVFLAIEWFFLALPYHGGKDPPWYILHFRSMF